MNNVNLEFENIDLRPVFILDDVKGAAFSNVKAEHAEGVPIFRLKNVSEFSIVRVNSLEDRKLEKVDNLEL